MLSQQEIDLGVLSYRALTPADREAFRREVIRRAHAERDAVIYAAFGGLWSRLLGHASLVQAGAAGLRRMWAAYRKGRERRIAIGELLALDDHMLKDMGISRSEIIAVVHAEHDSQLPPAMTPKKGRDKIAACVSQFSVRVPQGSISRI
jgi:uncharacterized protein YjiS (DUF1127 family)